MSISDLLRILPILAAVALIGRVLLACMPADRYRRSQLPLVWLTALYLGWGYVIAIVYVFWPLGLGRYKWLFWLPAVLLGVGRLLTLPGAMAPRHEPRREAPAPWHPWVAILVAILILRHLAGGGRSHASTIFLPTIHVLAATTFLIHGLSEARRAPSGRWILVLAFVLTPAVAELARGSEDLGLAACLTTAAAAYAVSWLRRANRRALLLACIALACVPLTYESSAFAIAVGGLVALVVATPHASVRRVTVRAALALGVSTVIASTAGFGVDSTLHDSWEAVPSPTASAIWWIAAVVACVLRLRPRVHADRPAPATSSCAPIQPPRAELVYLSIQLGLAGAVSLWTHGSLPFTALLPTAALATGLLLPAERP